MALLLPFTFTMDTFAALAMLMGMLSVTVTSDTIPSVLFGVPGTVASQATILDGYPMARRGEAARAFGAAFTASVLGGLFGALLLAVSVPLLRPFIMAIGSPEMLAFAVFGLSLVAVLSGSSPCKGVAAACIGLMLATVGEDRQTGLLRYAFGSLYLWDGLPLVPLALGLFAIPELADIAIERRRIAAHGLIDSRRGQLRGARDTLTHPFLTLRCSAIGAVLGAVPGIGASVVDWIAYGHAARTEKGAKETFGKGDVRGVIAPESANNATAGGALVPTVAFGVPGSATMALLLGAFIIHGITPGPDMLSTKLDITYSLVWSVALANIVGAGLCFAFASQLAKIAIVRAGILVPVVLAVTYVAGYQGSNAWGDLVFLLALGLLGWIMKRLRWPRPPLILGMVLGPLFERYLVISVERYGATWLTNPIVMGLFALALYGLFAPVVRGYLGRRRQSAARRAVAFSLANLNTADLAFTAVIAAFFVVALSLAAGWQLSVRLVPQVVALAGLAALAIQVALWLFAAPQPRDASSAPGQGSAGSIHMDIATEFTDLSRREVAVRAARYLAWCLAFLGLIALVGFLPAMLLFTAAYMVVEGRERWGVALAVAVPTCLFAYVLFHRVLTIPWPRSLIGLWFPELNEIRDFALF
jgi:TctA family transporter